MANVAGRMADKGLEQSITLAGAVLMLQGLAAPWLEWCQPDGRCTGADHPGDGAVGPRFAGCINTQKLLIS